MGIGGPGWTIGHPNTGRSLGITVKLKVPSDFNASSTSKTLRDLFRCYLEVRNASSLQSNTKRASIILVHLRKKNPPLEYFFFLGY